MPNFDLQSASLLEPEVLDILGAVEKGMGQFDSVPLTACVAAAHARPRRVPQVLAQLGRMKLVHHDAKQQGGGGYTLSERGHDVIALASLMRRNIVTEIGQRWGGGKESDLYLADAHGHAAILKFHHLGHTSFKTARTKRTYGGTLVLGESGEGESTSAVLCRNERQTARQSWLKLSRSSAEREYSIMDALQKRPFVNYDGSAADRFPVPRILGIDRHCVVMEFIDGTTLAKVAGQGAEEEVDEEEEEWDAVDGEEDAEEKEGGDRDDGEDVLYSGTVSKPCVVTVKDALEPTNLNGTLIIARDPMDLHLQALNLINNCLRCGIIHGDVSEYNIIARQRGTELELVLIDFPQCETISERSRPTLERDIGNIDLFFKRWTGSAGDSPVQLRIAELRRKIWDMFETVLIAEEEKRREEEKDRQERIQNGAMAQTTYRAKTHKQYQSKEIERRLRKEKGTK